MSFSYRNQSIGLQSKFVVKGLNLIFIALKNLDTILPMQCRKMKKKIQVFSNSDQGTPDMVKQSYNLLTKSLINKVPRVPECLSDLRGPEYPSTQVPE